MHIDLAYSYVLFGYINKKSFSQATWGLDCPDSKQTGLQCLVDD